nr:hypothetical protein [Tanacetum cinerariifolium]
MQFSRATENGNNSHDGYACQKQFPFVYEQEPSYNQNYDGNYYSHDLPSFPCCDYCGGSHENFQCQPDNQNVDFSGPDQIQTQQYPDQIQTLQYPDVQENSLTSGEFEAYTISNNANMNDIQFKLDNFQKKQQDFQEKFEQMQDDFQNQMWNFMQNFHDGLLIPPPGEDKEPEATTDTELSSTKDIQPLPVQEPPQNSEICQLIREECFVEVPEEQKQNMEKTMLDLVKICHHKQFICMYDNVEDLIEGNLDTKLLSIKSQCLVKKEQEVKNVEEQPAEQINSDKLDSHCFNVESDFVESLLNRDTFIDFSSKFDFSGKLAHIKPEIPKFDFDFEEEIRLIESLLYDNSFPRPPEELNAEIADTIIESILLLPILVQDGNSQQEEIDIVIKTDDVLLPSDDNDDDYDLLLGEADLFLSDNSLPPGIENVADDPERDVHFLEELLINDSILSHESYDSNFEDNLSIP